MDVKKHHTHLQVGDYIWLEKVTSYVVYDRVEWVVESGHYQVSKLHFDMLSDFYPITYVECDKEYCFIEDDYVALTEPVLQEYRGNDMVEVTVKENK